MILYIGNKHCTSVAQLKGYFSENLTPESDVYFDLLDYGRHGDIAAWLREMGEVDMASSVDAIDACLSDSSFYTQLKENITGVIVSDSELLKPPPFGKCFSFESVKCVVKDNEAKVAVSLKVLMCVNETYELSVSSNWGTRAVPVNPYSHPEGKIASFVFTLRKRPGKDVGVITVKADGEVLADDEVLSESDDKSIEILVGDVKFKMIHVEGGMFTMGATREQEESTTYERPTHLVTLSSYSIGETPVTQELWQAVMGSNPAYYKGAQQPVENVNWNDCQEFIRNLNQKTGMEFRMPTEAEWEFAARGGMKSNGYQYSGSNDINEVAWYGRYFSGATHPVKTKNPNELGLFDMSGNVWEWCQDWYGNYNEGGQTNPVGPIMGFFRVFRGGSWMNDVRLCRLSYRAYAAPSYSSHAIGVRLSL